MIDAYLIHKAGYDGSHLRYWLCNTSALWSFLNLCQFWLLPLRREKETPIPRAAGKFNWGNNLLIIIYSSLGEKQKGQCIFNIFFVFVSLHIFMGSYVCFFNMFCLAQIPWKDHRHFTTSILIPLSLILMEF